MYVPADIQYFLDCSFQVGHIAGDVYHYFMTMCPQTAQIIDDYYERDEDVDRHWHRLINIGLYTEDHYLRWRAEASIEDRVKMSYRGLFDLHHQTKELVDTYSRHLVEKGFSRLTAAARLEANQTYGFETNFQVIRRAVKRAVDDLSRVSDENLISILREETRHRLAEAERMQEMMVDIRTSVREADEQYEDTVAQIRASRLKDEKQNRKVVKRSIKFAQKLLGNDTTRMFIGGGKIRFEGKYADYEIARTGTMTSGHGGSKLSVFDKGTDIHLCDVCIYTPQVPVLDHVASIAMHIRSGHEEDILEIGNPYNVTAHGKMKEWLQPFLPSPKSTGAVFGLQPVRLSETKIIRMRKVIHREVFRVVEPAIPAIRRVAKINELFTSGRIDVLR